MTIPEIQETYRIAMLAGLATGFLFMLQTIIGMSMRIRNKQPGGVPVEGGPARFLFRADRARTNTAEVLPVFILALALAIGFSGPAQMVNIAAVVFVVARAAHMAFYYANIVLPRSLSFMFGNFAIIALLIASVRVT